EEELKQFEVSFELLHLPPGGKAPENPVFSRLNLSRKTESKANEHSLLISPEISRLTPLTIFNIFDSETDSYLLEESGIKKYLEKILARPVKIPSLKDLCDAAKKVSQPLHFRFQDPFSKQILWGTLTPVHFLDDHILFQYRPSEISFGLVNQSLQYYLAWILISALGALVLGFFLSRKMVFPIKRLKETVRELSEGSLSSRTCLEKIPNEIGELAAGFDSMAVSLENSFHQMEAIQKLHQLMLEESKRDPLLRELCTSLQNHYSPAQLIMGFFLEVLSENERDYYFEGELMDHPTRTEILSQIIEIFPHESKSAVIRELENDELSTLPAKVRIAYFLPPGTFQGSSEKICGVLILADPKRECPLQVLDTFCRQASTVLLKTWLNEIQEDTRHGGKIQQELMSRDLPNTGKSLEIASCFIPARNLGGDCFDVLKSDREGIFGILIGDVSGKGIGPALFGASAKAFLHSLLVNETDPSICLKKVNEFLCSMNSPELFLTLFLVILNVNTGKYSYASAGHNNMIHLHKDQDLELLSAKGLPLGMFPNVKYETKTGKLLNSEVLILYTDGIPELENPKRELFGQEQFEKICLSALPNNLPDWTDALMKDLHKFRRGAPPSDDITLVALRYYEESKEI
ncbi:SpoIIE family protein phosphatase, partial [bacterium]|nr:SpoIIE family protein phosphatase [bacterium]